MAQGIFITLEGGEGSGKTTQIRLLADAFRKAGRDCVLTREPGGVPSAEALRKLLVEEGCEWTAEAETLLFYAARMEHISGLIRPALSAGKIVLCDRFSDSTAIYQGIGKGVIKEFIARLHRLCLADFMPHITLILDISPKTGLLRAHARRNTETRFERLDISFHEKVREGFRAIAVAEPQRCTLIDAGQPVEVVHAAVIAAINQRLGSALKPVEQEHG